MGLFFSLLDTWKQQWGPFVNTLSITLPLMVGAGWVGWMIRGIIVKERIAVYDARLKLADEKSALADKATNEIARQFQAYKEEVAANAPNSVLAVRESKIDVAIDESLAANKVVRSAVGKAVGRATVSGVGNATIRPDKGS